MAKRDIGRQYEEFVSHLAQSLKVDSRFGVLEFSREKKFVRVLADSVSTAIQISKHYQKRTQHFKIKVRLLPDRSVGNLTRGVCKVGVAPVRKSAASTSEQVTQILYGESFDVLENREDWVRVRLNSDGYLGWVASGQIVLLGDHSFNKYASLPKVFVVSKMAAMLEKPDSSSQVARVLVCGSEIASVGKIDGFLKVMTPDGEIAFVDKRDTDTDLPAGGFSRTSLVETASRFKGISYSWGGRSPLGFDCSGFVQTVFALNGIHLPRDADLQFLAGKPLGKKIERMRPGDLLFFSSNGNKISHVAIYIGNRKFIHSSGFVRISTFEKKRKEFDKSLLKRFIGACRVI